MLRTLISIFYLNNFTTFLLRFGDEKHAENLVSFSPYSAVSDECNSCDEILAGLEKIDQETDNLDITFIKINDPRYNFAVFVM